MKTNQTNNQKSSSIKLPTVYIGNLHYEISNRDLKKLFSEFGMVKSAKIVLDSETEKSKGIAFIQMFKESEAQKAIKSLNGFLYEGRTLKVSMANDRFAKVETQIPTKSSKSKPIKIQKKPNLHTLFDYLKTKKK